jgi:hypothetical protein
VSVGHRWAIPHRAVSDSVLVWESSEIYNCFVTAAVILLTHTAAEAEHSIYLGVCIFITISERHETVVQINCNNDDDRNHSNQKN